MVKAEPTPSLARTRSSSGSIRLRSAAAVPPTVVADELDVSVTPVPFGCATPFRPSPTQFPATVVPDTLVPTLIPDSVAVGGFVYDVDTGLLDQKF